MTEIRVHTLPERIANPETISTSPTHNFCGLDLLKEDWSNRQQSGWGANNPPGIEGWSKGTELGVFHASQALGLDPFDATSSRLVNEWTAKRSVEVGQELRERYHLPVSATKMDVVHAAVSSGQEGRFCAASQGVGDKEKVYDGMVSDLVTSELVERYRTRFSKSK